MAETKDKTGATARLFQVLSVLVVGGFLYWLYVASEPTEFAVAEEDVEEIEAIDLGVEALRTSPFEYIGEQVRIENTEVTEILRQGVFFFRVGDEEGVPLMVRMSDELMGEAGFQPLPGDRGLLVGTVQEVEEELIERWNQAGVFEDPEQLLRAQTQPVYLFATRAEIQPPEPEEDAGEDVEEDADT